MKPPSVYRASEVKASTAMAEYKLGKWTPAREVHRECSLVDRLRVAWRVFTGRCDALDWEDGREMIYHD